MTADALRGLLARLEAATGGSRLLDFKLDRWALAITSEKTGITAYGGEAEPYTCSLDAAVALCERVKPGGWWMVEQDQEGAQARVGEFQKSTAYDHYGTAPTPALALCIAVCRAKLAEADGE